MAAVVAVKVRIRVMATLTLTVAVKIMVRVEVKGIVRVEVRVWTSSLNRASLKAKWEEIVLLEKDVNEVLGLGEGKIGLLDAGP